ncbi:MAG: 2'-deoxycytidine 5'-triphosphate deaminase, partial [Dehalococcoidia bacterium]|nr:2'-deoxycytidine 5'-triphosphate deaminase [Dehalococcoidia bacterium]
MVLSDRSIRREIEAGNIVVDPLGENAIQPASVDLRLGNLFRVFRNARIPFIDVKQEYPDLTDLVEIEDE